MATNFGKIEVLSALEEIPLQDQIAILEGMSAIPILPTYQTFSRCV